MPRLSQVFQKPAASRALQTDSDVLPLAVLEFQSPTAAIIATPIPRMARSTNWMLSAMVFFMLLAAGTVKVDKLASAMGEVVSNAPDSTIQAFNASSIVQDIKVHAGDIVTKGQVLATLNPTYASATLSSLTQQEQGYAALVAQLEAQENGKPYVPDPTNPSSILQTQTYNQQQGQYNFTMQDYAQKISALQTEIAGYQAQAVYYEQRLGIASNVEAMRKKLQQLQVGSLLDTEAATDDRVSVQADLANALSSVQTYQKQLASQIAERSEFDQQWRATISQQLAQAINSLAQAQEQLAEAKLDDQLVTLTAPQDAIVQTVAPISVGSVLQPGQPLMDLAPINAPLSVEADIDSAESGFVRVGNRVNIKFATLPFLQYGSAKGTVTSISPESFNPLDQTAETTSGPPLPGAPQDLYYKAEISIDVLNLHNVPPGFRLVPGMPVQADLIIGHHTILGYFMSRMMPVAYNSMHEP